MDVAIKDYRMPENCIDCHFQYGGWCEVAPADIDERVAPTVDAAIKQGKPEWCPLYEIKPALQVQLGDNGSCQFCPDCQTMVFDPHADRFCRRCGARFGGGVTKL